MANAKNFYSALSTQEKRFIDDKTMSTTLSVKNWITFLQRSNAYDAYIEKQVARSTGWIVLCVIITLASIVAYASLLIDYLLVIPLLFGMLSVWLISRRMTLKNRDINNYLRKFFMPFLDVMKDLAGEEAKLSAAVDFRDPMKHIKPSAHKIQGRDLKVYEAKYIAAKISLKDGSYLETVIADDIRKISYRNPRGKLKSKTKTVHHYYQRLTLPKNTYKLKGIKLLSHMEMAESPESFVFKLKGKGKILNYEILTIKEYMQGIKHIYNQVQPLNQPPPDLSAAVPSPAPAASTPNDKVKTGIQDSKRRDDTDSSSDAGLPTYFWSDHYFDRHDFDSTRMREEMPALTDEDLSMNIFDS